MAVPKLDQQQSLHFGTITSFFRNDSGPPFTGKDDNYPTSSAYETVLGSPKPDVFPIICNFLAKNS